MMDPADIRRHLAAYADGELVGPERIAVEAHLRRHPDDVAPVRRWRELRGMVGRMLLNEPVPAGLAERVRAGLAAGRIQARPRWRVYRLGLPGLAVAAAILLAVVVVPRGAEASRPIATEGFAGIYRRCALTHHHDTLGVRGGSSWAEFQPPCDRAALARLRQAAAFPCHPADLSTCGAYHLNGACECAPNPDVRVVHAYFLRTEPDARVISAFVVDQRVRLCTAGGEPCPACTAGQRRYCSGYDGEVTVVAWVSGNRSYVLAGQVDERELVRMADSVAVAALLEAMEQGVVAFAHNR